MGLLDSVLGSSIEDPKTQATMAAIQGLLSSPRALGGISQGLLSYGSFMQEAKQRQAQEQLRQMQMQQMALQFQQAQKAAAQQELDQKLTQQAFTPVKPIEANQASGITGPRPAALSVVGQQPAFNPAQFISSGGSAPLAFQLAQSLAKDDTPQKLAPGEILLSGKASGYKPLANNPKDDQTNDMKEYARAVAQGYKGSLLDYQLALKRAGATNVTLSTEKDYAGKIAAGLADRDLQAIDAAKAAPDTIASSQRIRQILASNQAFTGTGAETRLAVTKALATAGLVNGNSVTATEDLQRELSQGVLGHIKSSGLGVGSGFSNADRDFLEKAAAGKIDVNAQTLAKTAELAERAARKSIDAGNQALKRVRSAPGVGTIPMMPDIAQPAGSVIDFASLK